MSAELPAMADPNICTAEEAAAILEPYAEALTTAAARKVMLELLITDKPAGEDILAGLRGATKSLLSKSDAWKLVMKRKNCFSSHSAMQRVADMLFRDQAAGELLLASLKPLPKGEEVEMPPPPQHDPMAGPTSPEQKAAAAAALIKEVQKEGRFTNYSQARDEARRRNPPLFS